jgi:diguanylate cyclase (GGDEF)-like protein
MQDAARYPQLSLEIVVLLGLVAVLLVASAVLGVMLVRSEKKLESLGGRDRSDRKAEPKSGPAWRVELELAYVADFIRDFPRLLYELQSLREVRRIPSVLLGAMLRVFRAEQAVVLVRRRGTMTEPELKNRLIVTALASTERGLKVGTEIAIGEGQLGVAAEAQRVMDRHDFVVESAASHDRRSGRSELVFDVVAPMVVGGEAIGVIAFSRPERHDRREKEMLQMIAQLGAMTWANLSTFRTVKHAADYDELTGIFNKASLNLRLSELVYEARQNGSVMSVFIFDIDNFKNYNDVNGHLAGDQLLRLLAQLVREAVRSDDIFGRFGGEEFLLIMPGRTRSQAVHAAESIRQRIATYDFPFGESQPLGLMSVSGGVATFPEDAQDSVDLLRVADAALYRAKHSGRNRVARAETGLNPLFNPVGSPEA